MKPTNPSVQSQRAKINALLRKEARSQEASVNDLRKQYTFSLFLRKIFSLPDNQWLLLGGNALILRTGGGRYTQDIDLARAEPFYNAETVQQELQLLIAPEESEGLFRFDIHQIEMRNHHVDDYGYETPAARASVIAYLGVQEFDRFSLDIVQQLSFDAGILQKHLKHEKQRRKIALPSSLQTPGRNWQTDFPQARRGMSHSSPCRGPHKRNLGARVTAVVS